jgi:hypothetical protein
MKLFSSRYGRNGLSEFDYMKSYAKFFKRQLVREFPIRFKDFEKKHGDKWVASLTKELDYHWDFRKLLLSLC